MKDPMPDSFDVVLAERDYAIIEATFGPDGRRARVKVERNDFETVVPFAKRIVRSVNAHDAMLAALKLYDKTYAATQTHPTPTQEAVCIAAARAAMAMAEAK